MEEHDEALLALSTDILAVGISSHNVVVGMWRTSSLRPPSRCGHWS